MAKVRGVRFSENEEALIEEFLSKNQFFDFSTLAKIAILEFIRKPSLIISPVSKPQTQEVQHAQSGN